MQINGCIALVTGGASGLGNATARTLIEAGAEVFILDLPGEAGEKAAAELGPQAHFLGADVTDEAAVRNAVEQAAAAGELRIVVNCAGVATPGKLVGREGPLSADAFMRVVKINLLGTINVMAQAAVAMKATELQGEERGVIINTASVAAFDGQIGQMAYSASKGAVAAVTLPAARELARDAVRVMTIAPGIFETPMMAGLPQAAQDSLGQQVPHPARLGKATEYAQLVRAIVENPMLNGETIRLDGAIRMAPK